MNPATRKIRTDFYSRPCGRGDGRRSSTTSISALFLLTPLREWRPLFRGGLRRPPAISTHAPAGGATSKRRKVSRTCQFLLTPLREGRRGSWGKVIGRFVCISTHAPAGGATQNQHGLCRCTDHFYSRPCGRGDPFCIGICVAAVISTHAPAGGATSLDVRPFTTSPRLFLLTPLREGRLAGCRRIRRSARFLLTPLREGRPRRR